MKLTSRKSLSALWLLALPVLMGAKGCAVGNEDASLGNTGSAGAAGDSTTAIGSAGNAGAANTGGDSGAGTGGGREPQPAAGSGGDTWDEPCPVYDAPDCGDGRYLVFGTDEDGCSIPVCEACPSYALPLCGDGEHRAPGTDENGCVRTVCEPCPAYAAPACDEGEPLIEGTDENGCYMPTCGTCPDVDISCSDAEYIVFITDEAGCRVPTCQSCPEYSAPLCADDEYLTAGVDENGCPMPVCRRPTSSPCFSPTQNLDTAYSGGVGCSCGEYEQDRCIDGVALICEGGTWTAVEDGPCGPSICNLPLEVDYDCLIADHIAYWHNPETGQCEPFWGGCPTNDNAFLSFDECSAQCLGKETPTAVVPWPSCEGLGEELSYSGGEFSYASDGQVVQIEQSWGCGCPTRPEFVLTYEATSPLRLRLCHDELADTCEMFCSETLSFDLSQALLAAGTTEFVFVD